MKRVILSVSLLTALCGYMSSCSENKDDDVSPSRSDSTIVNVAQASSSTIDDSPELSTNGEELESENANAENTEKDPVANNQDGEVTSIVGVWQAVASSVPGGVGEHYLIFKEDGVLDYVMVLQKMMDIEAQEYEDFGNKLTVRGSDNGYTISNRVLTLEEGLEQQGALLKDWEYIGAFSNVDDLIDGYSDNLGERNLPVLLPATASFVFTATGLNTKKYDIYEDTTSGKMYFKDDNLYYLGTSGISGTQFVDKLGNIIRLEP